MISWESVCLMVDHAEGTRFQKEWMKKRFRKIWKTGQLYQALTPLWKYRLCCARLYLKDYSDYSGFEWRDEKGWSAELYFKDFETPGWNGLNVNRLVVMGEQGIGDQVMYASILPKVLERCKEVVYECDQRLHTLLERSLGVHCRPVRESGISADCDAFIPAAELMRMFRRSAADFPKKPFLKPDPERVSEFLAFTGKVGVSWRGRQGSLDPETLPIGVNLQYDGSHPDLIEPGIDLKNDIEGVVALCSVLERIVCVPTSVMHFAGALGKKVDVIEPNLPGETLNQVRWDSPPGPSAWYPNVYVHRSQEWNSERPISSARMTTAKSPSMAS